MSKARWLFAVLILAAGTASTSAQTILTRQSFDNRGEPPTQDGTFTDNGDGTVTLAPEVMIGDFRFGPLNGPQPPNSQSFGGGAVLYQQTAGSLPTATIELLAGTKGFAASEFGVWQTFDGNGRPTSTSFFAAGQDVAVPGSGSGVSATYNGGYIVVVHHNTANAGARIAAGTYSGSMTMAADFGAQSLSATFSGFLSGTVTPASPQFVQFAGNHYAFPNSTFSSVDRRAFSTRGAFYGSGSVPPEATGTLSGVVGGSPFTGVFWAHS